MSPRSDPDLPIRTRRLAAAIVAACGCVAPIAHASGPAVAGAQPPASRPQIDPASLNGRDFAGTRLPVATQRGGISIRAQRIATWSEEPAGGAAINPTASMGTQRAYLRGDVEITLAYARFRAARAVVWIEPLEESTAHPGEWVHQVAVYFDRLSDPAGEPGITPSADRMLVTGVVDGPLVLSGDSMTSGRPADVLVVEGERRLGRYLRDLLSPPDEPEPAEPPFQEAGGLGTMGGPILPGQSQPFEPNSPLATGRNLRPGPSILDLSGGDRAPKLFSGRGIVSFTAGEAALVSGETEDSVLITGGVVVMYTDVRAARTLEIRAERAVVFLDKGARPDERQLPAAKVRGIYLEGDVVGSDGQYTLRGSRVYYDVANNRAMALDAVFWTYDAQRGLPFYVRAKALRQTAAQQVEGDQVTLSASSFFEPQFSLAARSVTITRERSADEIARTLLVARDVSPRIAGVPYFYWPSFSGDSDRFPLRDVRFENSSENGFAVKTRWDMLGILGIDAPGWTADLLLDGWFKRGVGVGADIAWKEPGIEGNLLAYMVPDDRGTDVLPSGVKRDRDGEFRGMILGEHRWDIDDRWTLFLEAAHISDETFLSAWYRPLAETHREFANSATIRYLGDNSIFLGQFRGTFNDFAANDYLLQSLGYSVNKTPELYYARTSDDLLGGTTPGLLTWSHEYRVGVLSMAFTEPSAADMGFNTIPLASEALGILPTQSPADRLRLAGLDESLVLRADTRQELDLHLQFGPVNVTPFVVGRLTAYDTGFSAFAPADDDQLRLWGAVGVRADTTFQRVDDSVHSDFLDLHRIRHIVTPSLTAWAAATNREQASLPVLDERVESITDGGTVRAGVTQVWQTQRGGEGRWRTVDVFRLRTDVVWSSEDTPRESPIGHFVDYRPEYSNLGRFFHADGQWQVTDSLALTFRDVYSFDTDQQAAVAGGLLIQHSADFSTFAELHYINARNATYLDVGGEYRLTPFYVLAAAATYDTDRGEFQRVGTRITREFEAFDVGLRLSYDNITDEFSVGLSVQPHGVDVRKQQLRRLGRDQLEANSTGAISETARPIFPGERPASGPGGPLP